MTFPNFPFPSTLPLPLLIFLVWFNPPPLSLHDWTISTDFFHPGRLLLYLTCIHSPFIHSFLTFSSLLLGMLLINLSPLPSTYFSVDILEGELCYSMAAQNHMLIFQSAITCHQCPSWLCVKETGQTSCKRIKGLKVGQQDFKKQGAKKTLNGRHQVSILEHWNYTGVIEERLQKSHTSKGFRLSQEALTKTEGFLNVIADCWGTCNMSYM